MKNPIQEEIDRVEAEYQSACAKADAMKAKAEQVRAEARTAYEAAVAPLQRLLESTRATPIITAPPKPIAMGAELPTLRQMIEAVLGDMPRKFGVDEIKAEVQKRHPSAPELHPSHWSRTMREFIEAGKLVEMQAGVGKRKAIYAVKDVKPVQLGAEQAA